jgi:hypothetical protein
MCFLWLTAKLLLAFTSTVILCSEPHGTHDHILLFDGSGNIQHSLTHSLASSPLNCCWPRQHSHSWFRVLRESWLYITVSWLLESCNSFTGFYRSFNCRWLSLAQLFLASVSSRSTTRIRVRVILRTAVYRQSVCQASMFPARYKPDVYIFWYNGWKPK